MRGAPVNWRPTIQAGVSPRCVGVFEGVAFCRRNEEEFDGSGYEAFTNLLDPRDYTWYVDRGYAVEFTVEGGPERMGGLVFDLGLGNEIEMKEEKLVKAIRKALPQVNGEGRTNLASICSVCLKLKLSEARWVPITEELPEILVGQISHGLCPDCVERLYPELADELDEKE